VVWPDGNAADVRMLLKAISAKSNLWEPILEELPVPFKGEKEILSGVRTADRQLEIVLEVGWGTIEVITGPFEDLYQLQEKHEEAMKLVVDSAHELGMKILATGTQPITKPSLEIMTPRPRYLTNRELLGSKVWDTWCVTASDQIHVDVSREEAMRTTNLVNMLHPVVVALCGNSPFIGGEVAENVCSRQSEMRSLSSRHGMPRKLPESFLDHVQEIMNYDLLWLRDEQQKIFVINDKTYEEWAEENFKNAVECSDEEYNHFLAHDHYIWHSARPRSKQRTVECRAACQQPWPSHMSAAALHLGLVEGNKDIWDFVLSEFGDQESSWKAMLDAEEDAEVYGLATDSKKPLNSSFLNSLLDKCSSALEKRGKQEEQFLEPLYSRVERRENPAQEAVGKALRGGVERLIAHTAVKV